MAQPEKSKLYAFTEIATGDRYIGFLLVAPDGRNQMYAALVYSVFRANGRPGQVEMLTLPDGTKTEASFFLWSEKTHTITEYHKEG